MTLEDNKRIAKNTFLLYCRLFVTIITGLYTSRIVINVLGFSDFGLYNVVGGVVTMLTFLNVGLSGASQRFITYELGRGDLVSLKKVFCNSVSIHFAIALLACVIFETIGIWFINAKLNIPEGRYFAANWVFQCSILTFAVSVISVPYYSCIIAHEKMGTYAAISIFDMVSRLAIALGITLFSYDRLILYASLMLVLQLVIRSIYTIYCKRHFEECSYHFTIDKKLFKQMFAFAGWGCVGNMGFSLKDQCSNVVLNLFFGTVLNAARGIATQVNGVICGFAGSFTMAMNPQITKRYAAGDIEGSRTLAYAGSKYTFFLLSMAVVPFIINEHYVLRLWLGDVPKYTDEFVVIVLLSSLIYSMTNTMSTALLATGKIKVFQSSLAFILLLEVPITYIMLLFDFEPHYAVMPMIATNFATVILRIYLLHKLIPSYSISQYMRCTVLRCFVVFIISFIPSYYVHSLFEEGFWSMLITALIGCLIVTVTVYILGLNASERIFVTGKAKAMLNKSLRKSRN